MADGRNPGSGLHGAFILVADAWRLAARWAQRLTNQPRSKFKPVIYVAQCKCCADLGQIDKRVGAVIHRLFPALTLSKVQQATRIVSVLDQDVLDIGVRLVLQHLPVRVEASRRG